MQTICDVRIDERLIHGQVATYWQGALKFTRIMVIDEPSANDEMQKSLLRVSCPTATRLSVLGPEKAAENLKSNRYDNERVFIVCKKPQVILDLYKYGFKVDHVTVGNMSGGQNKKTVIKHINVTEEDIQNFHKLEELGIPIHAQLIPVEAPVPFMPLLKNAEK